jgi:single-stranded DNA-binding protein
VADEMQMLGSKAGGAGAAAGAPAAASASQRPAAVNDSVDSGGPAGDFDDDIPF